MTRAALSRVLAASCTAALSLAVLAPAVAAPKERPVRAAKKALAVRPAPPAPPPTLVPAGDDQRAAAALAHYGDYACEFSQTVSVQRHPAQEAYVEVTFGRGRYVMKPVLSSTGALRLEDVAGRMLMIQIASKSMLMDTQVGRRLVDECVHEQQRLARAAAASAPPAPGIGIDPDKAAAEATQAAAGAVPAPPALPAPPAVAAPQPAASEPGVAS